MYIGRPNNLDFRMYLLFKFFKNRPLDKCLEVQNLSEKVHLPYFINNETLDFECYPIFEKGPCLEGEWLVLNKTTGIGECKKRPCNGDALGSVHVLILLNHSVYQPRLAKRV